MSLGTQRAKNGRGPLNIERRWAFVSRRGAGRLERGVKVRVYLTSIDRTEETVTARIYARGEDGDSAVVAAICVVPGEEALLSAFLGVVGSFGSQPPPSIPDP